MRSLPSVEPIPRSSGQAPSGSSSRVDVAVIGAGIVGLGIAWVLARSGRSVCVVDPNPAMGATRAAAGMLAPVSEYHHQEEELLALTRASAHLYPAFVRALEELGTDTGYLASETLLIGIDAADRQTLRGLYDARIRHDLPVEPLTIRDARAREPLLSPRMSTAYLVADDHQVDPRLLAAALREALAEPAAHPGVVRFEPRPARSLLHARPADPSSAVVGIELGDGTTLAADEVIVANGLGAGDLGGLPPEFVLPLRPVYGDILRVAVPPALQPLLRATVRGMVHGNAVYLVPRRDGTVVIGATQRESGTADVSAGGVYALLRDAQQLLPAIAEADISEMMARARPGTPDNKPLLGRVGGRDGSPIDGLIIATGFFRHGVLLTPVAAEICLHLVDRTVDSRWAPFRPDRFSDPSASPQEHK